MKVVRIILISMGVLLLSGCIEYSDEERQKVEDLVDSQMDNFISVAKEQYGNVEVLDIKGETYNADVSNTFPSISIRAGDGLTGKIVPKSGEPFDVRFSVDTQSIESYQNYEAICQTMADELEEHGINVLAIELLNSASKKPMYEESFTSYKELVDIGTTMRFRVITDSKLGDFEPDHFASIYDDMVKLDETSGYLRINIARTEDNSEQNVDALMGHWMSHDMAFSKHESIYYDGEYRNGDPRLSKFSVVSTLSLDDSRDGAMKYTDENDVRIITYRTPDKDGEYSWEVKLNN